MDGSLLPGFADPVHDSQRVFRMILEAMSRPGQTRDLGALPDAPSPLNPASAAALLALADFETPVWMDRQDEAVAKFIRFHTGAPFVPAPDRAVFALITAPVDMPPLRTFAQGTDEYPDRSATLIVQVPSLTGGPGLRLTGPGIRDVAAFAPVGLPDALPLWLMENHGLFPCGVDLIFAAGTQVSALPRTTQIEV